MSEARRAYERARLRRGAVRAAIFGAGFGVVAAIASGPSALVWLPLLLVAWTFLEWRGGPLLRGGRVGAAIGVILAVIPEHVFMACCRAGCALGVCCSTSRSCLGAGTLIGLGLAVVLETSAGKGEKDGGQHGHATAGACIAVVATSLPRCSSLMLGEAMGLLLGLGAGALAAALVREVFASARRA